MTFDHLNDTIPIDSFQAGRGGSGTNAWEPLDRYSHTGKVYRGIILVNNDPPDNAGLGISLAQYGPSSSKLLANAFILPPRRQIVLEIDDPSQLRVAGIGGGVDYAWIAY